MTHVEVADTPVREEDLWGAAATELERMVGTDTYHAFCAQLVFDRRVGTTLFLTAPTPFLVHRFGTHYQQQAVEAWNTVAGTPAEQVVCVLRSAVRRVVDQRQPPTRATRRVVVRSPSTTPGRVVPYYDALRDTFVVGATFQKTLRGIVTLQRQVLRIVDIQDIVAKRYNLTMRKLKSSQRTRDIVRPRQLAMYAVHILLPKHSLPQIGKHFGGRDHTTVLHAIRKVEELRQNDPAFATEVAELLTFLDPTGD